MTTITFEREFNFSQQRVYDFVSKSEHLLKWWGPEGVTIEEGHLDFSRAGPWKSTMVG